MSVTYLVSVIPSTWQFHPYFSHLFYTTDMAIPSICQSPQTSTSPAIYQLHDTSVHHTNIMTSLSVCQSHILSVCHTINMTSLSICQTHITSVHHTNIPTRLSVCQSHHSSVSHTANITSPSISLSTQTSVCHTVNITSPSVCQLHDLSVCQPTHDVTRNTVCKAVCPSPVTSILPSAKFVVKMPVSIPV